MNKSDNFFLDILDILLFGWNYQVLLKFCYLFIYFCKINIKHYNLFHSILLNINIWCKIHHFCCCPLVPHRWGGKGQSVFNLKKVVNIFFVKFFLCIFGSTFNGHSFTTKLVNTKFLYGRYFKKTAKNVP